VRFSQFAQVVFSKSPVRQSGARTTACTLFADSRPYSTLDGADYVTIGFALMGCGRIAHRHASLLANGQIKGATLVAVCDPQGNRAAEFSEKYGIPGYKSLEELMANHAGQVGVVSVLTESGLHAPHTLEVVKYGKHVVVEKPMALTLDDADAMIQACDAAGVRLFVVKQNRFNRPVVAVRDAFLKGKFGRITMGTVRVRWSRSQAYYDQDAWRGTWAMDGGVFSNQASHHVDLLRYFLGEPVSVFARTRTALVDIECEDTGVAIVEFASGAIGVIEATTAVRPKDLEGSLSLLGETGTAIISGFAVNQLETLNFTNEPPLSPEAFAAISENPPNVYGFGHQAYYDSVVKSLSESGAALVDGLEGRRSLELILAIYESAATGQPVSLRYKQRSARLGKVG
jgi:predicted dehydrogenase